MPDQKINKNHELCLSIFDQLFDWEIYLNFICFAYDRSPRPFRWHWLTILGNFSESHRFWLHREREIDAISVDRRNPPNLWLRFFTAREREEKMWDVYHINHKLSAEHDGPSIKNDLRNGFCLAFRFLERKHQTDKNYCRTVKFIKMNEWDVIDFSMNDFGFVFPNYIDRLKKEQHE